MDQTSLKAYQNIKNSDNVISLKERILAHLQQYNHATKGMIALELGLAEEQVHKRLSDLKNEGMIVKTPHASVSKQTGQLQHIWAMPETKALILFC